MSQILTPYMIKTRLITAEVCDIGLFLCGLLIPFGDYSESFISLGIDIYIFSILKTRRNLKATLPFLGENLDLLDWIFGGKIDLFGLIEIIPFWLIVYVAWNNKENIDHTINHNSIVHNAISDNTVIEANPKKHQQANIVSCPSCQSENDRTRHFCQFCGYEFKVGLLNDDDILIINR